MYNDRKSRGTVRFDYVPEPPIWIVIVRNIVDIVIILAIITAFVLIAVGFIVYFPQMW